MLNLTHTVQSSRNFVPFGHSPLVLSLRLFALICLVLLLFACDPPNTAMVPAPNISAAMDSYSFPEDVAISPIVLTNSATAAVESCSATDLPEGLAVAQEGNACQIAGTPANAGGYSVAVTATNAGGNGTANIRLNISARLIANAGGDSLLGTDADETFVSGTGDDTIDGAGGEDTAQYGSAGSFTVSGDSTSGYTVVSVALGSDTLRNIEIITLSSGDDTVTGLVTGIMIRAGAGEDTIALSTGDDNYTVGSASNYTGFEIVDGMAGSDTLNLGAGEQSITVGAASYQNAGITYTDFENYDGGEGNDTLNLGTDDNEVTASDPPTLPAGYTGFEIIDGGGGEDTLNLSDTVAETYVIGDFPAYIGFEIVDGGTGADDILNLGAGDQTFTIGEDYQAGGVRYSGFEIISGGAGTDTLNLGVADNSVDAVLPITGPSGYSSFEVIDGGSGNDTLNLSDTMADTYTIGTSFPGYVGFESVNGGTGAGDTLNLPAGGYTLAANAHSGFESINGGSGADNISGTSAAETINGGAENDTIDGGGGADTLNGGAGNDTFIVANAEVSVDGGEEGSNTIEFALPSGETRINLTDSIQEEIATVSPGIFIGPSNNDDALVAITASNIDNFSGIRGIIGVIHGNDNDNRGEMAAGSASFLFLSNGGDDTYVINASSNASFLRWYDYHDNGDNDRIDYSVHFPGCSLDDLSFTQTGAVHLSISTPELSSPTYPGGNSTVINLRNAFAAGNVFASFANGAAVKTAFETSGTEANQLAEEIGDYFIFDDAGECRVVE